MMLLLLIVAYLPPNQDVRREQIKQRWTGEASL